MQERERPPDTQSEEEPRSEQSPDKQAQPEGGGMRQQAQQYTEQARERAQAYGERAQEYGHRAQQRVESGKEQAASSVERAAGMVRERAGNGGSAPASRVAEGMESAATYLHGHDTNEMRTDLESYTRAHPGRAIAAAVAVGFLLGRMLR